eukprot:7070457-Prymnesium_polylepis.1
MQRSQTPRLSVDAPRRAAEASGPQLRVGSAGPAGRQSLRPQSASPRAPDSAPAHVPSPRHAQHSRPPSCGAPTKGSEQIMGVDVR